MMYNENLHEEERHLIQQIAEQTERGKIDWELTEYNTHCRVVAFCRPSLSLLGVSPIRPRGIGVDDAVLLHAADLLSAHGRWILQGFRS